MNQTQIDKDIIRAQKEFEHISLSCYVFLTKNGLKGSYAKDLLMDTLNGIIEEYKKQWNVKTVME